MSKSKSTKVRDITVPTARTAKVIDAEISKLRRALRVLEKSFWAAVDSIAQDGAAVFVDVADSHGKVRRKIAPNIAFRIKRETERTINQVKKDIAERESEKNALQEFATRKESALERFARNTQLRGARQRIHAVSDGERNPDVPVDAESVPTPN
jgi:hypothetical protein